MLFKIIITLIMILLLFTDIKKIKNQIKEYMSK
jgi:hypothetical protein